MQQTPSPPTPAEMFDRRDKFHTRAGLLIALAIFAQESAWNFYDAQVPAALRQYTTSAALIGLLMGMDNFLGLFIQPWIAHRSDNTRTRWGRRVPYLAIGAPIAAAFYVLIPWANSMVTLVAAMFSFAMVANSFKAVTESLIPDFQAPQHRGKATAIAKIAVAVTVAVSAALSFLLIDKSPHLAFAIPAMLLVVGIGVACLGLNEKTSYSAYVVAEKPEEPQMGFRELLSDIWNDPDKSRLLLIIGVFAAAGTWSAMRSQLTPYAMEVLHLTRGQAGSVAFPGGIVFMLVAFPMALISDRSRRLVICKSGVLIFVVGCLVAFSSTSVLVTTVGVAISAVGYAAFAVNGIVIMWNLAPSERVMGAYTGIYGIAVAIGSTAMPAVLGLMVDLTSWRQLMLGAALLGMIGFLPLSRVRSDQRPSSMLSTAAVVGR